MAAESILNRKALRDYHILERYEAGLALKGSEVKSIRAGKANISDAFARIENGEAFLYNADIQPYEKASHEIPAAKRVRKLLLHRQEIDILINNAGFIEVGPLEHMTREDFERAMRVHFWAPFELSMQVGSEMRTWGGGRIVNISSIGGKIAVPHLAPYCASKFALTGFSDALRAELARDKIYVTTVAPGMMRIGSHVNANFKGKHDAEFAWFATSNGMPLISINANRAARKILAACRRGQPSLTLTFAARGAILGNALFPNFTGYAMKVVNRLLPGAAGDEGNESRAGSETHRLLPAWLTCLVDRATVRNNENRVG